MNRVAVLVASALAFTLVPYALMERIPPRWRARLGFIALLGMMATLAAVLAAILMPEVLTMSSVRQVWQMCSAAFHAIGSHPFGRSQSILAGILLGVVLGRFWWTLGQAGRTSRRARIKGGHPWSRLDRGEAVYLVPLDEPEAYSIGSRRGQVVVTRGLLELLDQEEQQAVLLHEEGHLRAWHQPMLLVARAASAALSPFRPAKVAMAVIEQAIEESADDYAARKLGRPVVVASGLSKAALGGVGNPNGAVALGTGPDVAARLRRLIDPPATSRWTSPACGAALGALVGLLALTQAVAGLALLAAVHHVIGFGAASFCPLARAAGASPTT